MKDKKAVMLAILIIFCSFSASFSQDSAKLKAGFIYIGSVGDAGWNYSHEYARLNIKTRFPNVETFSIENVHPDDAVKVAEGIINRGAKIIFATSQGYLKAVRELAQKHPDITFYYCSAHEIGIHSRNMLNYYGRIWEDCYVAGYLAGLTSKNSHIGFLASKPIPENVMSINAFCLGARRASPEIDISGFWTGEWQDGNLERNYTTELIDNGADLIFNYVDSSSVIQVAAEKKVDVIASNCNLVRFGTDNVIASLFWKWEEFYAEALQGALDRKSPALTAGGLRDGVVGAAICPKKVPEDIKNKAEKLKQKLANGNHMVFTGPVYDQQGVLRIDSQEAFERARLFSMDWMPYGVDAAFPEEPVPAGVIKAYIVQSYEQNNVCGQNQSSGIRTALAKRFGANRFVAKDFFMNTKTINREKKPMRKAAELVLKDIKRFEPDIVFTVDDNAFKFVGLKLVGEKFPVIFSGLNGQPTTYDKLTDFLDDDGTPNSNITGVYEKLHLADSVRVMREVIPQVKKVAVLLDISATGKAIEKQLEIERAELPRDISMEIHFIEDTTDFFTHIDEINADPDVDAVYMIVLSIKNDDGRYVGPNYTINEFIRRSRKPSMALNHVFAQLGLLGGASVDFHEMGAQTAFMGCEILSGTPIGSLPVEDANAVLLIFNVARARMLGLELPVDLVGAARVVEVMEAYQGNTDVR